MVLMPLGFSRIFMRFFGPQPKFQKGESVQCITGGPNDLMVVQWATVVNRSMIMYSCKWYDSQAKSTRTNIFREEQLKRFDWYHASMNT